MNFELRPLVAINELKEQNKQLDAQLENFHSVLRTIEAYRNETNLLGRTYQAHKDYFGEGHVPYIKAQRKVMQSHREANESHIQHLSRMSHT